MKAALRSFLQVIASLVLALALLPTAQAGTQVLGFELGVTTLEQVRNTLAGQTRVEDAGVNHWNDGPMLKTDGKGYDVDALQEVTYIFDRDRRLAAVLMRLGKHRFGSVHALLAKKYRVEKQQLPFVGDQYARFATPDAMIELEAPHLSFEMHARYLRRDFAAEYRTRLAQERDAKRNREAAKF